jgi:methanogenic corrinoid protein MtbC1
MNFLLSAFQSNNELDCSTLIQEAENAGLRRTEMLIGLLQPALYEIGEKWERAEIDFTHEQRFTSWCEKVFSSLSADISDPVDSRIILANLPGNTHTLGIRFLSVVLNDLGYKCHVIHAPQSPQDLIEYCIQHRSRLCGISVSMPGMAPDAFCLADAISEQTHGATQAVLGGFAFRTGEENLNSKTPVFRRHDEFMHFLKSTNLE